ncbi:MAG: cyclase family protein [Phycisphaerales bacterium JB059]
MSEANGTLYDISPALTPDVAVFPGDSPLRRHRLLDMSDGAHLTLSTLQTTVHAGAHADAPSHYGAGARTMEQQDLGLYLGPCQVLETRWWPGQRLGASDVIGKITEARVLLKTNSWPVHTVFNEDYAAVSPELVRRLADEGVRLLGVDVPSVDPPTSKGLESHQACLERDVSIIEGLDLSRVPPGRYELIALPLKLVGFEGSPVRAVLRPLPSVKRVAKKSAAAEAKPARRTAKKTAKKSATRKALAKKTTRKKATRKAPAKSAKKATRKTTKRSARTTATKASRKVAKKTTGRRTRAAGKKTPTRSRKKTTRRRRA